MTGPRLILIILLVLGCADVVRGQDSASRGDGAPVHVVVRGETLTHVARAHGTSVAELKRLNGLSGDLIRIGQVLLLSTGVRATVAGLDNPASGTFFLGAGVQTTGVTPRASTDPRGPADARTSGDTSETAAARETAGARISRDTVQTAGARTFRDTLQTAGARAADDAPETTIGAPVQAFDDVAGGTSDLSISADAMTFAAGGVSAYVVEEGETLYSIADALGTKAYILHALNDGLRAPLEPGTVLVIPASASDTAWALGAGAATREAGPARNAGGGRSMAETTETGSTAATGSATYVVRAGDTLSRIALELETTVAELRRANELASDVITVGQALRIPGAAAGVDLMKGRAPAFAVGSVTVLPETYAGSVMANGRVYEPAEFVVAHHDLPFDTVLIVENGQTGRASFARVVDRHPREERVLMAISPALASEIGVESGELVRIRLVE